KKLPRTMINQRLVPQLVASANSVSANYAEACAAGTKADFLNKLRIVFKEANETRSHLRVLYTANEGSGSIIVGLGKESVEIIKIFRTILSKFVG
ncbi:four helix bundle protein, partial [Candidatus Microgenomates bacterium]|nr:four helix bundle protein [Candidatus Microgenomates bacterium]